MELLEGLYDVEGWFDLNELQKSVLFLVFQDHAKNYSGARLSKMKRVSKDPTDSNQVMVYYQDELFRYAIDTRTGDSVWY